MFHGLFPAMFLRLVACVLATVICVSGAAKRVTGAARGENNDVILNVTLYADVESVKEALGDDLGGHYVVVQVKVEPKYTKEIVIDRDDFTLRTDKDGDRTKPMAPSQISGGGSLVLTGVQGPGGAAPQRLGTGDYPAVAGRDQAERESRDDPVVVLERTNGKVRRRLRHLDPLVGDQA